MLVPRSNDDRDIETLRELPLESMLTSVLNAAIKAQAESALTTAEFVRQIGFVAPDDGGNFDLLSDTPSTTKLKIREAELEIDTDGSTTKVRLPFISLFNIPSLEIDSVDWSFKAELKSMESARIDAKYSRQTTTGGDSTGALTVPKLPIQLGASMKVEVKEQVDFAVRSASARQQKYSLHVQVKAGNGPTPRGIERLFEIADRIVTNSMQVPPPSPGPAT